MRRDTAERRRDKFMAGGLNPHSQPDDVAAMQRMICRFLMVSLAFTGVAASLGRAHAAPSAAATLSPAVRPVGDAVAEPTIGTKGAAGDYLRAVHTKLHVRWTQEFVKTVSATYPPTHPLNVSTRQTTVAVAIRWDGSTAELALKRSSGSAEFDRAVLDIVRKSAPFPLPVAEVISDDSYAHLEWTFARDHRACAAGAEVSRVDDPLEVSLPRLVSSNRMAEALRRVGQAPSIQEKGGALDQFARLYLGRTIPDPVLNASASLALAESGDKAQAPRLRAALTSRATIDVAARGLRKLGIDVCQAMQSALESGSTSEREMSIGAARSIAAAGGDISSCRGSFSTIVADVRQPTALRLSALDALVTFIPAAARPVVMALVEDKDPGVRGAALLASVRKGVGRPEMYRLAPLLRDKTVEIRGAASAGMVRAGGDLALEQLYLLARETDPRPGTWVAAELAQLSTPASAEFLGKMARRNNAPVQAAAIRALLARKDAAARNEVEGLKSDERLPRDVRAIAARDSKVSPSSGNATTAVAARAATESVRQMLSANRNQEAAAWIVEHLATAEGADAIEVLGAWLVRQPASAVAAPVPTPAAVPTQSAAPAEPASSSTTAANAVAR